jgi:hypothetical protein
MILLSDFLSFALFFYALFFIGIFKKDLCDVDDGYRRQDILNSFIHTCLAFV